MQALIDLFDIKDLIPHGYCLSWSPVLLWLHVISDLLMTLAYYSIPLMLVYFIRQRKDLPYPWLVAMFAGFIVACGTTHLLAAITVWIPLYWLDGLLKAFTAIISVATAVLMLWVIPRSLSLPSATQLQAEIQQRKTAEEALRVANVVLRKNIARTQLLLDSALDGIISMDHNGKVLGWNAQAEHIFGYSSEQALGREMAELIVPPAYRERYRQGISRFTTTGASNIIGKRLEITGLRADASEFPIELTVSTLEQKDNYFFSAYVRDITERRMIEDALRESENKLATILDSVEAFIYIKDCNYRYQYANQPVRQLFGKALEDIIGKLDDAFFDEATTAKLRENDRRVIELGERIATEEINTGNDNAITHTYFSVKQPLRHEDGSIYGLCGISTDIGERKQMEAHNNLLIAALEAAANGIVITDKDATVIWANSAFGRLTGYSPEEAVGNKPSELVKSGLQNGAFYQDMWANLLIGQHWRGELINKRKNGSLYHEELSIAPVKNSAGEITHFIGIKEDITERKEMEAQLQRLASTDPLTGLFNRRVFLDQLELERAKVARLPHYSAVLLMLDLDFFKRINDAYGHATGDIVLKAFAEIVRNTSRAIDIPARLGGEEFAILLSGADKNDARIMAERLREQVAATVIDHDAGPVQITVSIGAATLSADDINAEAVLHRADVALYEAKDRGRNQTCWFDF